MLDPLVEPKHSAPNLYASDLAPCQTVSVGIEYGGFIIMDLGKFYAFKLHTTYNALAILYSIDGRHVSNCQNNASYVCLYLPVQFDTLMSLKQVTFYEVENSTPMMGLKPTISR